MKKATIYINRTFGIRKIEVELQSVTTEKYAQYNNAVKLLYKVKGKRKISGEMLTYKPYCIIFPGWGHPNPESYRTDFDEQIKDYLKQVQPIHDFRNLNTN